MQARDVMGTYVITVGPDLDVGAVAKILVKNGISAVPVVDLDSGKLLGIISEGDLIRRTESGTERRRSWWLEMLISREKLAEEFVQSHARKVKDLMTRNVVTAAPEASLREIANLLERHGIKRVPIVANGRVVGIVSRANLVQALASQASEAPAGDQTDEKLRESVTANLRQQPGDAMLVNVIAHGGVVDLWGFVRNDQERKSIRVAAEATPGVRAVNDNLRTQPMAAGI